MPALTLVTGRAIRLRDVSTPHIPSLDAVLTRFREDLHAAHTLAEIDRIRVEYLGSRSELKQRLRGLRDVSAERRRVVAEELNSATATMERELDDKRAVVEEREQDEALAAEWTDVSLPGLIQRRGALHPITAVERRCVAILRQLGFVLVSGPEVDSPYNNFEALNIPEHHPARDMQDTFWVEGGLLLRSHTTTVQARTLAARAPLPIKVASAGRVYRNEAVDATHLPMFHQLEGLWLEDGLTFAHLKGVVLFLARSLYGEDQVFRVKPKYYPYTEPSLGLDVACRSCQGEGCAACHGIGWITLIGAGMVHPNVLRRFGYEGTTGFAFGWGTTRMTSQWLGLSRIRWLYESDPRLYTALKRNR